MLVNVGDSINVLAEKIEGSGFSYFTKRKKNQRIDFKKENRIGFLKRGSVSLYRIENNILTLTLNAPAILGLVQMLHDNRTHYFRCDIDSEVIIIDQDKFIELMVSDNLWGHAYAILSFNMQMYFHREKMQGHKKIKEIVLEHLRYLWGQGDDICSKTSIYTFILARNQVSRSSIHKVINQLTTEGLVGLYRGKLIWMKDS